MSISVIAIMGALQIPSAPAGETWAGVIPMGAAVALLPIAAGLILTGIRVPTTDVQAGESVNSGVLQVVFLVIVAILYQYSMRWFGYVLPTAIVAPIVLYAFGIRSWIGLAASFVLCPFVYHVIFFKLLGVFPPYGEMFDLLDVLQE